MRFKIQVSQKSHFKADVSPYILSFGITMFCSKFTAVVLKKNCYARAELSSAIESDHISDQFIRQQSTDGAIRLVPCFYWASHGRCGNFTTTKIVCDWGEVKQEWCDKGTII